MKFSKHESAKKAVRHKEGNFWVKEGMISILDLREQTRKCHLSLLLDIFLKDDEFMDRVRI